MRLSPPSKMLSIRAVIPETHMVESIANLQAHWASQYDVNGCQAGGILAWSAGNWIRDNFSLYLIRSTNRRGYGDVGMLRWS